jgi:hypothetical protein
VADKIHALKLAPLLSEYLFAHQRLDLPGIGTFLIREEVDANEINFENNPAIREVPELINFLSSKTGKMKALAAADLDSHLAQALQFLNIGKPFLFEGIGSLAKLQTGGFEFISEKGKEPGRKEITRTSGNEESFTDYENVLNPPKPKMGWRKLVLAFLILAGISTAVWLGYKAYKNSVPEESSLSNEIIPLTVPVNDRLPVETGKDSVQLKSSTGDRFKFVLETAGPQRAFYRYNKLKSYDWDVHMETNDSVKYKIFFLLTIPARDTARVLDSLTLLNGRKVFIEH